MIYKSSVALDTRLARKSPPHVEMALRAVWLHKGKHAVNPTGQRHVIRRRWDSTRGERKWDDIVVKLDW